MLFSPKAPIKALLPLIPKCVDGKDGKDGQDGKDGSSPTLESVSNEILQNKSFIREITDKIKELININRDSIIKTIKELRVWAKDNITPERKKELGIKEDDTYIKNSTEPGLGLGTAKTFVEAYSTGILIIPESLSINRKNLHYVHDRIGQKLSISIPNQEYKDFKKIAGWRKIKAYKEFFQFNDKEVEQGWGDIVSGL